MARVELDSTGLKSGCIIKLNDAIIAVNKTLNYFDYFDIPYDFSKRENLVNVEAKLRNIKKDLNYVKQWILDSNDNYNKLIDNLKSQANKLPNYRVKQRNNII